MERRRLDRRRDRGSLALEPAGWRELRPTYVVLLFFYSTTLKHVVIVDVLAIAGGFVIRAVAGAVAVEVPIGSWLLACTTLLALFLALSKRRHELVLPRRGRFPPPAEPRTLQSLSP